MGVGPARQRARINEEFCEVIWPCRAVDHIEHFLPSSEISLKPEERPEFILNSRKVGFMAHGRKAIKQFLEGEGSKKNILSKLLCGFTVLAIQNILLSVLERANGYQSLRSFRFILKFSEMPNQLVVVEPV